MRKYNVTFTVALACADHEPATPALVGMDAGEIVAALDAELPTTLWVSDEAGVEHGYDVSGSHVLLVAVVAGADDNEVTA